MGESEFRIIYNEWINKFNLNWVSKIISKLEKNNCKYIFEQIKDKMTIIKKEFQKKEDFFKIE